VKSLKSRIQRIETAKNKSKKRKYVVVTTDLDRKEEDLAKAKREHSGEQYVVYIISYIPDPAPLPDFILEAKRKSEAQESDV
jgi:hypothetical protein